MGSFFLTHKSLPFSYVGNLDRKCTERLITEIFSAVAPVVRCKIITSVSASETIYVSRLYFDQTEKIFLVLTGVLAIPCTSAIINLSCCETITSNRRTNSC